MKQRFSSLDVKVIAHELSNRLCALRLANVYDLSSRIYLLKFARPDRREQLIVDSGFRCHLTSFSRVTAAVPSVFVARLRKYLRSRRVTAVSQVGTDRIIDIQFSDGQYRLFLEFYAAGNIILTDKDLNILAILRIIGEGQGQEELRNGLKYNLTNRQNYGGIPPLTEGRLLEGLRTAIQNNQVEGTTSASKVKRKPGNDLRKALATTLTEFPPTLVEHALGVRDFDANITPVQVLQDKGLQERLLVTLQEAEKVMQTITSSETSPGYIVAKPKSAGKSSETNDQLADLTYEDFHPFKPHQYVESSAVKILSFKTFNETVDEFFSSIEGQKLESRLHDREQAAKKKLDSARTDHVKRLEGLQNVQQLNIRKAQAIEANLDKVEEAIRAVNGLIAQGMDWVEIARLIELQQSNQNPVADMIRLPLKLYENTVTLSLSEWDNEDDYSGDQTESEASSDDSEDEEAKQQTGRGNSRLSVDVDLALSPWANARQYYDQKRSAAEKEQKTAQQSSKAYKNMERKIGADLKKALKQEKEVLQTFRAQFWFEKFIFFISSDGYLVLGGRDGQQNEMLYKRHLKRGDVYVHADLQGAGSLVVKNNPLTPGAPIPPSTLSQAGSLSVAISSAWESKAMMPAWWVNSEQVSKIGTSGEYLTAGEFMTKGEKNFLSPAQLLLGFGVLFQISDESKARHVKNRVRNEEVESVRDDAGASSLNVLHQEQPIENDELPIASSAAEEKGIKDVDGPAGSLSLESEEDLPAGVVHANPLQPEATTQSKPIGEPRQLGDSNDEESAEEGDNSDEVERDVRLMSLHRPSNDGLQSEEHNVLGMKRASLAGRYDGVDSSQELPMSTDEEPRIVETKSRSYVGKSDEDAVGHNPSSQVRHVRGKHGKKKKLATKYADQDEEDRLIAMKLLGSATAKIKAQEEAEAKRLKEEQLERQMQRRREQHQRAVKEGMVHEEARKRLQDEEVEDNEEATDDVDPHSLTILDNLVGTPLPGDEILEAIPVCAPWGAMGTYKYKAKLQPGTQKKGKAIKEILARWAQHADRKKIDESSTDVEKMWPRELELIKSWKETEIVNTVPVGKVRVMLSGGGDSAGKGGQTKGKTASRGGKGSKKQR